MSVPFALPAAARPSRPVPRPAEVRPVPGRIADRLVVGGAFLEALALALFETFRCLGTLDFDTLTLLPAAACAGAAALCLGVALNCLRALRGA